MSVLTPTPFRRLMSAMDIAVGTGFAGACAAFAGAVLHERSGTGLALCAIGLSVAANSIGALVYLSDIEKQERAVVKASGQMVLSNIRPRLDEVGLRLS